LISSAWLDKPGQSWSVRIVAEFANVCLADGGIDVNLMTVGAFPPSSNQYERLVIVRQRRISEGCPDIYRPVTRNFEVKLPKDRNIQNHWLITDTAETGIQLLTTELAVEPKDLSKLEDYRLVSSKQLFDLPNLINLQVKTELKREESRLAYTVRFDIDCRNKNSVKATIRESRTGMSDLDDRPVIDWLWIQQNNKDTSADESIDRKVCGRFEIHRKIRSDYPRRLIVVNQSKIQSAEGPFSVYEIWAGNLAH
jgi:hypothetical protein